MKRVYLPLLILMTGILLAACSKKTSPSTSETGAAKNTPVANTKPAPKKIKTPVPKVIVVNDSVASRTFDGRYYYDLEGHRYWRNNKDGKYYLYNKSMATDPDFRKQSP